MPPPAAREVGRLFAVREAFWRAEVAVVLRAPVGWRREGPDMAPRDIRVMLIVEGCLGGLQLVMFGWVSLLKLVSWRCCLFTFSGVTATKERSAKTSARDLC